MDKIKLQNTIVLACAAGAAFAAIYTNTHVFLRSNAVASGERERCYGVSATGENDCATAKHSCAGMAKSARDPEEWLMVPKGLCKKLGGKTHD